jgi:hypothetical protein
LAGASHPWSRCGSAADEFRPRRGRRGSSWLILLLLFVPALHAHDPYDSFTSATLFPDRLELTVTMAQATALQLVDPDRKLGGLTDEVFAKNLARFTREGATLYIVTSDRTRLATKKVDAELTDERDIIFHLTYPRPAPGRLHFHAAFMIKLGEGYGGILDVSDSSGQSINWEQLSWANPNFEVQAPAAAPPAKKK